MARKIHQKSAWVYATAARRVSTNNNRVDMAAEGLDFSIRFGDGAWHGLEATELFEPPLTPLCTPELAAKLRAPKDLVDLRLL